jgi:hypothetical protein
LRLAESVGDGLGGGVDECGDPAGDLAGDVLVGKADLGEDLVTHRMIQELWGTPTSRHGTSISARHPAYRPKHPSPLQRRIPGSR